MDKLEIRIRVCPQQLSKFYVHYQTSSTFTSSGGYSSLWLPSFVGKVKRKSHTQNTAYRKQCIQKIAPLRSCKSCERNSPIYMEEA